MKIFISSKSKKEKKESEFEGKREERRYRVQQEPAYEEEEKRGAANGDRLGAGQLCKSLLTSIYKLFINNLFILVIMRRDA